MYHAAECCVLPTRKPRFRNVGAGKGVKDRLDPKTLEQLYVNERRPQSEIAHRYGCSTQFVSQLVREYGIKRPRSGSSRERVD